MKNYNDNIGNRTRDLPACSAVPQPTTPPRTRHVIDNDDEIKNITFAVTSTELANYDSFV